MKVREENDIEEWIRFFLNGMIVTSEESVDSFNKILQHEKHYEQKVQMMGSRSAKALKLLEELYNNPITDATSVASLLNITPPSAYNIISEMEKLGILVEVTGEKRGKRYVLDSYLSLFIS